MAKPLFVVHGPAVVNGGILHTWMHVESANFYVVPSLTGYQSKEDAVEKAKAFATKEGLTDIIVLNQGGMVDQEISLAGAWVKQYRYSNSKGQDHLLSLPDNEERWDVVAKTSDGGVWRMSGRDAALVVLGEAKTPGIDDTKEQFFYFCEEMFDADMV